MRQGEHRFPTAGGGSQQNLLKKLTLKPFEIIFTYNPTILRTEKYCFEYFYFGVFQFGMGEDAWHPPPAPMIRGSTNV
jgi:hypothetical protein